MATPGVHHPSAAVLTVRYQWQGEQRRRCFAVVDGEPVPAPCPEPQTNQTQPGLGTLIERGTKAIGIEPCGGCAKRKAALDAATPNWARRLFGKL